MTNIDIIEVLRNSKKYSTSEFEYNSNSGVITYCIGDKRYIIGCYDKSNKFSFSYTNYSLKITDIEINFERRYTDTNKILSKFGETIRNIKKFNFFHSQLEEHTNKIKILLQSYIKQRYNIDIINFESSLTSSLPGAYLLVSFPSTVYKSRNRWRRTSFDVRKEKEKRIIFYDVKLGVIKDMGYLSLTFNYNNSNGELTLLNVEETYKSRSKDISRIIRGEKLKRLTLLNENII